MTFKNTFSINLNLPGTVYLNAIEQKLDTHVNKVYLLHPYVNVFVDENLTGYDDQRKVTG